MPVVWAMGYLASRRRILPRTYLIFGKKGADVNVKNAIDLSERRGEVRGGGGPLVQRWCAGAACGEPPPGFAKREGSPGCPSGSVTENYPKSVRRYLRGMSIMPDRLSSHASAASYPSLSMT